MVVERKIPAFAGNQTLVIQPTAVTYRLSYPYYSHTRTKFIAQGTKITLNLTSKKNDKGKKNII
jgi:hypothetical protein